MRNVSVNIIESRIYKRRRKSKSKKKIKTKIKRVPRINTMNLKLPKELRIDF